MFKKMDDDELVKLGRRIDWFQNILDSLNKSQEDRRIERIAYDALMFKYAAPPKTQTVQNN